MSPTNKRYPNEVKLKAVARVKSGEAIQTVANDIGSSWIAVKTWVNKYDGQKENKIVVKRRGEPHLQAFDAVRKVIQPLDPKLREQVLSSIQILFQ